METAAKTLELINAVIGELGADATLGEAKTWAETLANAEDLAREDHE